MPPLQLLLGIIALPGFLASSHNAYRVAIRGTDNQIIDVGGKATLVLEGGRHITFLSPPVKGALLLEVRWAANLEATLVMERVCSELAMNYQSCFSAISDAEEVSELGGLARFVASRPEYLHEFSWEPNLVLQYDTPESISWPQDEYVHGPRRLQIKLGSERQTFKKAALDCQFFSNTFDTNTQLWMDGHVGEEAGPDGGSTVELRWSHPEDEIAEVVALFAACFQMFANVHDFFFLAKGMTRFGPSLDAFNRQMRLGIDYKLDPNPNAIFDARGTAGRIGCLGWDFPDVRFFPSEEDRGLINGSCTGDIISKPPLHPPPRPMKSTHSVAVAPTATSTDIAIVFTVYKRPHLAEQISAIAAQTLARQFIAYVVQNENHVDVRPLLTMIQSGAPNDEVLEAFAPYAEQIPLPLSFQIHHIHSPTLNQKYHGRFSFLNMISAEYIALFDDDKIPGPRWVEHALVESKARESIIGYSGRLWIGSKFYHAAVYRTEDTVQVDYVGQCWLLKSSWISHMWRDRPVTVENAEDMQFSAQALIYGGVRTFIASQPRNDPSVWCDSKPSYGVDKHSSSIRSDPLTWSKERTGTLNYMIKTRGFRPLLFRAPTAAWKTLLSWENSFWVNKEENGLVDEKRMGDILAENARVDQEKEKACPSPSDHAFAKGQHSPQFHVMVVFGTRPEAVKLAPVILELRARAADLAHTVVSTGQHREMLAPVLRSFGIVVDVELDLMAKADAKAGAGGATSQGGADRTEGEVGGGATLPRLAARILVSLDSVMRTSQPDVVVVQGDTSSALLGALSAFYWKVPVAHVEAGLRTGHRYNPFPEEMHRRLITALATLHFAPTSLNAWNVLGEMAPAAAAAAVLAGTKLREDDASRVLRWESGGVNSLLVDDRAGVQVVGSTAIDALHLIMNRTAHDSEAETAAAAAAAAAIEDAEARRGALLLVTAHRRENLGAPLRGICDAVLALVARYPGLVVAFPVHLAPAVQAVVRAKLTCQAEAPLGCDRIHLLPPLDHATLLRTMANSRLVLSDSGGLQEEAPALGVPLLVLRERTERVEGLHVGAAKLIGTQPERILREASLLLDSYGEEAGHYAEMAKVRYPYGDGTAAKAIVAALLARKSELIALKTASG